MRTSPSMVPSEGGRDTYLVLEDLGRFGRVWRETAEADANHETLIRDLLDNQYRHPTRIVAFNTAEGWSCESPWILPTSYADGLPNTMTCRFP